MSLQLVAGSSGTGKSFLLYKDIVEHALLYPMQPHIVLVPEQFTLSTQRSLVMLSPNKGIMNIEVLSFERLAWRVFDELGTDVKNVLEDTGKSLLLRRICDELSSELKLLRGSLRKPGFIDELKSLLSEFGQYGISPDDLGDFLSVENMSQSFYGRIEDIGRIYKAFFDALKGKYITAEQVLGRLGEVLERSAFVKDAYIVCDGYTGFTPVQKRVFAVMLSLAQRIRVSVTIDAADWDNEEDETGLFAMSHEFIRHLVRLANDTKTKIEKPLLLTETGGKRFKKGSCLSHLEAGLFRTKSRIGHDEAIALYSFDEPYDEVRFVLSEIRRLIKADSSLKYRDFAILCADINDYRYMIEEAAIYYDIPVFVDSKDQVMRSPFIELLESVIHLFAANFSYESVMRYLKCGFSPLNQERIDSLDNYLVSTGLHGKGKLGKIFDRFAKGISVDELVYINESRAMLMEVFDESGLMKNKATVTEHTRALYAIITGLSCNERLNENIKLLEEREEFEEAQRIEQLYPKVMELLDKLVFLMGDVTVSIDEYEKIVSEGLAALKVGVIPPSYDSVTFGDMERTRIGEIDTLFLIGMSDARIPKRFEGGGLILQSERERLFDNDIVLAPTDRQKAFYQRFYLYMAVCRPKNKLYLTYPLTMEDEQDIRESYLISGVKDCFEGLSVRHISGDELLNKTVCDNNLEEALSDELRKYLREQSLNNDKQLAGLLAYFKSRDEEKYAKLLEAAGYKYEGSRLSSAVMDAIYNEGINVSASRLERYAGCAYSYYCNYILSLEERQENAIQSSDMGSLYHEALERYSNKLKENNLSWHEISEEDSRRLLEESINETFLALKEVHMTESAREEYVLKRMRKTLSRTVGMLTDQVRQGSFVPENFEISISRLGNKEDEIARIDDKTLRLVGIIDRQDIFETENTVYIKIIDYKSGAHDTDISDAYDGLQLQLFLYADAAKRAAQTANNDKDVVSAAVFYYQVKDPLIETDNEITESGLVELLGKELRVTGLVCDEREVVAALDKGFAEAFENNDRYASFVIPVSLKKDGNYSSASHVISRQDFDILEDFARKKAADIAGDILDGKMDIRPYIKKDSSSGCDYCPYHSVCGFDSRLMGYEHRKLLEEKAPDTVLGLMKKELDDDR